MVDAEVRDLARLAVVKALAKSGKAARIRHDADVSAAAVGRAVGVSYVTVLRWEKGDRSPTGAAALRYLQVLETLEHLGPPA